MSTNATHRISRSVICIAICRIREALQPLSSLYMRITWTALAAIALCLASFGCHRPPGDSDPASIVGVWSVTMPEAPFPYHLFVFHSDGTMQQANPDAGDAHTSDSNGMGVWASDAAGNHVKGKFVELIADRTTHQFVSRGEISFVIQVSGNNLHGTARASFYDTNGQTVREPISATLNGQRVLP